MNIFILLIYINNQAQSTHTHPTMSDFHSLYFTLDAENSALLKEYTEVWRKNEEIWNERGVCVKQLFQTTDDVEHNRLKVELKRLEDICEKTHELCKMLFELLYPPVVYDYDDGDSDDYILGDVC